MSGITLAVAIIAAHEMSREKNRAAIKRVDGDQRLLRGPLTFSAVDCCKITNPRGTRAEHG